MLELPVNDENDAVKRLLSHSRSVFFELAGCLTFRQHGAIV